MAAVCSCVLLGNLETLPTEQLNARAALLHALSAKWLAAPVQPVVLVSYCSTPLVAASLHAQLPIMSIPVSIVVWLAIILAVPVV